MRDPLLLAQSLYIARREIMGDLSSTYGVEHQPRSLDPVEDVCLQVVFHERQAERQMKLLGSSKFSIVSYERFCKNPHALLDYLSHENAELKLRAEASATASAFSVSNTRRLPKPIFQRMRGYLSELGAGKITGLFV
jgi:hypothetical protein